MNASAGNLLKMAEMCNEREDCWAFSACQNFTPSCRSLADKRGHTAQFAKDKDYFIIHTLPCQISVPAMAIGEDTVKLSTFMLQRVAFRHFSAWDLCSDFEGNIPEEPGLKCSEMVNHCKGTDLAASIVKGRCPTTCNMIVAGQSCRPPLLGEQACQDEQGQLPEWAHMAEKGLLVTCDPDWNMFCDTGDKTNTSLDPIFQGRCPKMCGKCGPGKTEAITQGAKPQAQAPGPKPQAQAPPPEPEEKLEAPLEEQSQCIDVPGKPIQAFNASLSCSRLIGTIGVAACRVTTTAQPTETSSDNACTETSSLTVAACMKDAIQRALRSNCPKSCQTCPTSLIHSTGRTSLLSNKAKDIKKLTRQLKEHLHRPWQMIQMSRIAT